jgi:hypothetical protein
MKGNNNHHVNNSQIGMVCLFIPKHPACLTCNRNENRQERQHITITAESYKQTHQVKCTFGMFLEGVARSTIFCNPRLDSAQHGLRSLRLTYENSYPIYLLKRNTIADGLHLARRIPCAVGINMI